jgi:hypothetical protein
VKDLLTFHMHCFLSLSLLTSSYKSDEVRTEVLTRLLCEADDAEVSLLTVDCAADTHEGGYLRNYMSEDKLSRLLVHAAAYLSSSATLLPRVIQFYELARGYVEVLEELNDQLAKVLVPPRVSSSSFLGSQQQQQQPQERDFWLQFGADFNEKHFAGGDNLGTVVKTLGAAGRGELMHVFQLLLKLAHFVKLHHEKK